MLNIALIGRPNVGKSTLFNRLAGKRLALVDDTPGVTRDWRLAPGRIAELHFNIIDTAGLEEAFDDSLEARMRRQTERAIDAADVALLIIDSRAGITPLDRHFAAWLRRGKTPVLLVANKCEGRGQTGALYESYELGLGDPIAISAEHGEGLGDLYDALLPFDLAHETKSAAQSVTIPDDAALPDEPEYEDGDEIPADPPEHRLLQLAIVGRPNVGKSTLLNALLGEERVLTGPEAGMTRDAISADWTYKGRPLRLVDTAGMRRRARVDEKLEKLAVSDGLRVVRLAQVVVLVLDAEIGLDKQDLTIARLVESEGRALVIALNKWDSVSDRNAAMQQLRDRLEFSFPQMKGLTIVPISALRGQGLNPLLDAVLATYDIWNRRISTAKLNMWLKGMTEAHPPPLVDGHRVKLRYMTQIKARPPTFAAFVTRPIALPDSYSRYLVNGLREAFAMPGVPIRFLLRKNSKTNPYDEGER